MDLYDLKFNPEFKKDYVLTLNNSIGRRDKLACYCEKHRCFVTHKQINSGNRHCFHLKDTGNRCAHCIDITDDNFEQLKEKSKLEEVIRLYAGD